MLMIQTGQRPKVPKMNSQTTECLNLETTIAHEGMRRKSIPRTFIR